MGGRIKAVMLRFAPEIARIMQETLYHPSQSMEPERDGSVIMNLRVTETKELKAWILGWGERVEVLKPSSLRQSIASTSRAMTKIYAKKHDRVA